jgi:CheY-like chemotaxis protein
MPGQEKTNSTMQSVEAIHSAVALPIDEILNDTVLAIDLIEGQDSKVKARLQDILKNAREIKQVIQKVGSQLASENEVPAAVEREYRPKLKEKRILVIDAEEAVRTSAHNLLEPYGCIVETAHEGKEAILMVRNSDQSTYDAIIADIRLPDIGGYELLMQLKEIVEEPPLILMTGFGYDPGHSIVKARQAGLRANAVLFKPFRLDQLLETLESTVESTPIAPN